MTDNVGVVIGFRKGSSSCLLAHTAIKALHDVAAALNIHLSVIWRRRCSDELSIVADNLSKSNSSQIMKDSEATLGYTSRTLMSYMRNPRPERCLGRAITQELSSWMEIVQNQVEWADSFSHLVKYPKRKIDQYQ